MRLYKAEIEFDMMVYAENEEEAANIAADNATDELHNVIDKHFIHVREVKDQTKIPKDWLIALPYSRLHYGHEDEDLSCQDLMSKIAAKQDQDNGQLTFDDLTVWQ